MSISETIPLISLLIHIGLFILCLVTYPRQRGISFGIMVYLIAIAPYANFFLGVPGMIADRFLLVPSLGWSIALAFALALLSKVDLLNISLTFHLIKAPIRYAFLTILLLYSVLTFSRNMDWRDYLTLFRHDIKYVHESAQAHNLLALRLMKTSYDPMPPQDQEAMRREGIYHFVRATEIYPAFFNATYDAGRAYTTVGNVDSAVLFFKKSITINPSFFDSYLALGELLFQQHKAEEARTYFQKLIILSPHEYTGYDKTSYTYFYEKNYPMAIALNKDAIINVPSDPHPYIALGKIYHMINRDDSTKYWLGKALEVDPSNQEAQKLLQAFNPH